MTVGTNHRNARTNAEELMMLQKNLQKFEHLLDFDGEFAANDADWERQNPQDVMMFLKHTHALEVVRRERCGKIENTDYRNVYRWNEKTRQKLLDYADSVNRFADYLENGCHCQTNITNKDGETFVCNDCGQEYTRSQIKQIEL